MFFGFAALEAVFFFAEGAEDGGDEAGEAGFEDVVGGAAFEHFDDDFFAKGAGDEDEGEVGVVLLGEGEGAEAVEAGEGVVEEDDVGGVGVEFFEEGGFGVDAFE